MPDPTNQPWWEKLLPSAFQKTKLLEYGGNIAAGRAPWEQASDDPFAYQGSQFQFEEEEPLDPELFMLLLQGYNDDQFDQGNISEEEGLRIEDSIRGLIDSGRFSRATVLSLFPSITSKILSTYNTVQKSRKQPEDTPQGELIGNNLIRLPDGSYTDKSGQPINQQVGEMMWQKAFRDLQPDTGGVGNLQSLAAQQKSFINQARQAQQFAFRAMARQSGLSEEAQRRRNQEQFEQARQQAFGQFSSPIDWVERLEVELERNPFRKQPMTSGERLRGLERDVTSTQGAAQRAAEAFPFLTEIDLQEPGRTGTMAQVFAESDITAADTALRQLGKAQTEGIEPLAGDKPRSKSFDIPDWLSSLYPSQFQKGGRTTLRALGGAQVAPISASVWNRLPWTTQQGFLGLARFQGQDPKDMLGLMARQLPQPRGVPVRRPARQRTSI